MPIYPDSALLRRTQFANDAGKTGIISIAAYRTSEGDVSIQIRLAADVPSIGWDELMPRLEAKVRNITGHSNAIQYDPNMLAQHEHPIDRFDFNGDVMTIKHIPLEKLDEGLAAIVGALSSGVSVRDGQGISAPLLTDAAATKAVHELGLKPFVEALRTQGYGGASRRETP
ncbi:MAG: hypothetical protein J0M34_00075 [Alphaproteobacteria bacterium]|nr:hypothetical protein [Alphaproteobacteria bacterium]